MEFSVFLKGLGALCWEHAEDKRSLRAKPAMRFLSWTFCRGDSAEGFTPANGSPNQKSFKHLDCVSEQLFFRLRDTFCICAATGCDQTQESTQVTLWSEMVSWCLSLNSMWLHMWSFDKASTVRGRKRWTYMTQMCLYLFFIVSSVLKVWF